MVLQICCNNYLIGIKHNKDKSKKHKIVLILQQIQQKSPFVVTLQIVVTTHNKFVVSMLLAW